tara:strand:+ start:2967 stop:4715 length:1749 start_codon:yes stop_codon:yes gene_type:complete
MSSVVDAMIEPMLLVPPFFDIPPFTEVICSAVELIKGGEIENIPGIGQILKYGRESILIIVLLIALYVKAWQYIGPKLWHLIEDGKNWARNTLTDGEPEKGDYDLTSLEIKKILLWWGVKLFITGPLTFLLQVPINIMSWDMESLSLDFGNLWGDPKNFYRGDCGRFINGSYAGDYSLYEKEIIGNYTGDTYTGVFNDQYQHSPNKYLCTHGNYCSEMSDAFGLTMMGQNASMSDDKSPTNGYVNGINITSAPRKYVVCCENAKTDDSYRDCDEFCNGKYPHVNIRNPFDNISWDDIKEIAEHPINTITEPLKGLDKKLFPKDHEEAMCHMHNAFYNVWNDLCIYPLCPQPTGRFSFKKNASGIYNGCEYSIGKIEDDITRNINTLRENCKSNCSKENDAFFKTRGCNTSDMEKAKRSALRNRNDVLLAQLPKDYEDNKIKDRAIKRTPWKPGERPLGLNPENTEYNRGQQVKRSASLTTGNGTVCSRQDLSEVELDECFGPFKPMTAQQYPVLFYKITKDFMGSILWTLFGIFLFFIILYILCLFNPIGREAYEFNKNAGMVEGGMKSMGIDMGDITKMIK